MGFGNFTSIWVADFEFRASPGDRPEPVCLVAKEILTGQTLRLWGDDLQRSSPPYPIDENALFVAFYASAEMSCHLALGWPMPENILDLYVEFRNLTNGKTVPCGNGLLGALAYFGLDGIESTEKESMRNLVLRGGTYSTKDREDILDYCESDVVATEKLFRVLASYVSCRANLGHAILRGRYTKAVADMEMVGIPIDGEMLAILRYHWDDIKIKLIACVDARYGVYHGTTFKHDHFAKYLQREDIPWPRLTSGRLALDDDTFSEMVKSYPQIRPLKDLRNALGQLRLNELAVGNDSRNRAMLSMFRSKTGRNQPSNSKFAFGLSAWLRGLIKPEEGYGLAYVDWSQQEFGIASALSGDLKMQKAYASGDPYLAFARQAGAVPPNATKTTHAAQREQFKACVLAVQYGMREESLAKRIQQPPAYARELLRLHRQTYRGFWEWSDGVVAYAQIHRKLWTVFGWDLHVEGIVNERSIRNFPMQSNGAEMLRLACCLATEQGIRVVAPVHDAVLIEAPLDVLESVVANMQSIMRLVSATVLGGFELRSDAKIIRYPDRYSDERGVEMWNTVMDLLAETESEQSQRGSE
jgi:DNA polymerase-1